MRVEGFRPYLPSTSVPQAASAVQPKLQNASVADISAEGWRAYAESRENVGEVAAATETQGCETCRNRKYVDQSNDPSVSFQAPTRVSPGEAASKVVAHEGEHVSHGQAKAERDGRKVISQTVSLESSICLECGRVYISRGVTRTITAKEDRIKLNSIDLYA